MEETWHRIWIKQTFDNGYIFYSMVECSHADFYMRMMEEEFKIKTENYNEVKL